ncbi:MAG: DUF5067 domain-containing protein [Clostridia bacterium]|nr:DUF5067 domain-containing protein [Clostridia bacterium]
MKKWLIAVIVLILGVAVLANLGEDEETPVKTNSENSQVTESNSAQEENDNSDEYYYVGDYGVKIKGVEIVEDSISKCAIVTYEFKNNSKNPQSFNYAFSAHAYQGGVELNNPELRYVDSLTEYNDTAGTNIKGGVSIEVDEAYRLIDEASEVEIVVGNSMMSLAGAEPLTQIFSIAQEQE